MDEQRKIQKVGYSTLSVSIPSEFARVSNLHAGDSLLVRQEADGTLRLIPSTFVKRISKATIKADQMGSEELLSRLIIGCYILGYDTIEVVAKNRLDESVADNAMTTMRRLRGLEVVDTQQDRVIGQSFMDPTKFPVDSLIKRLQILVSRSLGNVIDAIQKGTIGRLNEVRRTQDEVDELYWLIARQLLVALNHRELAAKIGIESPLHASGDRVTAKTLEQIGVIILDLSEEIIRLRGKGGKIGETVVIRIERLARKAQEAFNMTVESLLTPDIKLVKLAIGLVDETLQMEKEITHELLESGEYAYSRIIVSHLGQLARYCNIIIEIASHRLLRKTSRVVTVQHE
ncbi:MAG: phosphate uptake regulator PhoU [Thaumarchaeota archaeon]|nr:phosphate uptake regulator PhoU [Nitrososphaerota archaeon]